MAIFEARLETPTEADGEYIFPTPIDTFEQRITNVEFQNASPIETIVSNDGAAFAYRFRLTAGQLPIIRFEYQENGPGLAENHFEPRNTRFERPSDALIAQITSQFPDLDLSLRVPKIIQFIGDQFSYGRREFALGDKDEFMQALECGLTEGSCVDMHTFAVTALRTIGVKAAYVMGCHIATGRDIYSTGHCWLNVRHEGVDHHWDISHHVQYGRREITSELNPKPGRRFALSTGRGHIFSGQDGAVEFPALSGFHLLSGALNMPKIRTLGRFKD